MRCPPRLRCRLEWTLWPPAGPGEAFHITPGDAPAWGRIQDAFGIAAGVGPVEKVHVPAGFISKLVPWQAGNLLGDKAASAVFDNTNIKRVVPEFNATTTFQNGIRETVAWFDADPARHNINAYFNTIIDTTIEKYRAVFDRLEPI